MSGEWTLEELLALADRIGERIDAGRLPAQNEYGQYMFSPADLAV